MVLMVLRQLFIYFTWVAQSPGGKNFKSLTEKLSTLQTAENFNCNFSLKFNVGSIAEMIQIK